MVWFERLKELRRVTGVSCRELDRLAGTTRGYCWALERGSKHDVGVHILAKYCAALGCTLDWLIHGKGPRPTDETILAALKKAAAMTPVHHAS